MSGHQALRPIDLARAVGVSAQMVRRYEAWGFLPPAERSPAGYRRYGARHLAAIRTARAMQQGYGWQAALAVMQRLHQGDLAGAVAQVDARHAALHREREATEETLGALRTLVAAEVGVGAPREAARGTPLRVGEAARTVGVRVSAVRFWEAQGLLQPSRDQSSRYRLYDEALLLRLRIVALLRRAGYGFAAIRGVLAELGSGRPEAALSAVERHREELTRASSRCAAATAAFWGYAASGATDEAGTGGQGR